MENRCGARLPGLLILSFRILLGIMFLYAGITKIMDPAGFAQAIANYRLLPGWAVSPAAIILPWVEVLAGTSVLLGLLLPGGALVLAVLLLVFAFALGIDLWRGLDISCGCFGAEASGQGITWWYVLRDILLAGMAAFVWLCPRGGILSLDELVFKEQEPAGRRNT